LRLLGEKVLHIDPHIGLLHRGTEKLIEHKTYLQAVPYFDRLDYVSMLSQEHAFALAVEKLLNIEIPERAKYIRILFVEITRLLNHLMAITAHAMDVGAVTPFLWAFEEREKLMEFYERVTGARMHTNYIRPGGVAVDLQRGLLDDIAKFLLQFDSRLNEIEELLSDNRIWKQRLINVGKVDPIIVLNCGFSGILVRGTGLAWDLRRIQPYEVYSKIEFDIPIGLENDCFERYLMRLDEMRETIKLLIQCIYLLPLGPVKVDNEKIGGPYKNSLRRSMESLINHFLYFSEGFVIQKNDTYTAVESPKGEFGVFLISNDTNRPYRCKIRSPGYFHLQNLNILVNSRFLADLVTLIGSLDIVFGEIDR